MSCCRAKHELAEKQKTMKLNLKFEGRCQLPFTPKTSDEEETARQQRQLQFKF